MTAKISEEISPTSVIILAMLPSSTCASALSGVPGSLAVSYSFERYLYDLVNSTVKTREHLFSPTAQHAVFS
jgi:hypothetical protein